MHRQNIIIAGGAVVVVALLYILGFSNMFATEYRAGVVEAERKVVETPRPTLDREDYDARLLALAHVQPVVATTSAAASSTAGTARSIAMSSTTPKRLWPVKTVYPNVGAILPFNRIVAYYGNFYSKGMGVLGEYPTDQMLAMFRSEIVKWSAADPTTPVLPAIQYIAAVAQGQPGKEGKYILRMPDSQIDHALDLANQMHGILILDVQVGMSTLAREIPFLESYLKMPNVHLAIDPEFSMKYGNPPGTVIGTFDAADINYAAQYLATLVQENQLPPKILVVHRFTPNMVTNYRKITPLPEVQIVMDMDGWGSKEKKRGTYRQVIAPEPVQFTGIKLFYKNDLKPPSTGILSTSEVFALTPTPIYIQYQ